VLAILGSGFGLYGYLPALVGTSRQKILLLERYRARLGARPELAPFEPAVEWAEDVDDVLARANGIVLALRPADQVDLLVACIESPNIRRLLLEKPVAPDPESAAEAMARLKRSGKIFGIGYTFRHTSWAPLLARAILSAASALSLEWHFMAHHFQHDLQNWKRRQPLGGGVVRFYGIQLIALLAEFGYRGVDKTSVRGATPDEPEFWTARFTGEGLPPFSMTIDSRSDKARFRIEQVIRGARSTVLDAIDPFGDQLPPSAGGDRRIGPLLSLCRTWLDESDQSYEWYDATIELWRAAERASFGDAP